jgi:hypothetical protein
MKKLLGRVHVPDKRDRKFAISAKKSSRRYRYWEGGSILDQNLRPSNTNPRDFGTCVGAAWAGWLLAPPITQYIDYVGLYDICKFYDSWKGENYEGTSVRAGAKVLEQLGFISQYNWAFNIDALVYSLLELGPVTVGVNWYAGMDIIDKYGYINVTGPILGGHAFRLTGVNNDYGVLRMNNSWGTSWGINGRAWITIDDFEKLLKDDGEVCLATESSPWKR